MVPRQRYVLTFCCAAALLGTLPAADITGSRKFYADDPLWSDPSPRPVRQVAVRKVDDLYDFVENSYVTPGREGKAARMAPRRALDVNTVGEVPDGSWYTNRHWQRRMSLAELQRGPGNTTPPSPEGAWRVVGAKSDGVTPGFIIEDTHKNRYLLKLDPPAYPELCSAADVIGSKFFYALGYYTPENYVVHFRPEKLSVPPGATWRDATGRSHPLTDRAKDELLKAQHKDADGSYRALASRWIGGQVVGPFSYRGTRSDDPNDIIAHEDRRVLRGLAVFSAWLNHHDTRSINTMDALVSENGRQYVKHHLIDFGSILGSAGYGSKDPWTGHQYTIENKAALLQVATLSLYLPRWARSNYPKLTGVGLFDSWSFNPLTWKSNYPNPAFLMMDSEDALWAAKQVAAFTDEEIRAIVQTGEYSDPRATDWVTECLIKRRDKIVDAWYARVVPLDRFRMTNGELTFEDLAAGRDVGAARTYDVRWSSFDNERGLLQPLPDSAGTVAPRNVIGSSYLAATITCAAGARGGCPKPVTVYVRRDGGALNVVGVDR